MLNPVAGTVGNVFVHTTQGRGATPEEIAERALDKIIYVGSTTHPAIREQAEAFKDAIREVLVFYLIDAVRAYSATLVQRLTDAGYPELVAILDA